MGDALMSVPALYGRSNNNIVAFIGDGARNLVPNILPSLIEQIENGWVFSNHNLTVFYMINGTLSVINSYKQRFKNLLGGRQMEIVTANLPEFDHKIRNIEVVNKNIFEFDEQYMKQALFDKHRINFFNVMISHNDEGDGMSLITEKSWQRGE